MYNDMNEKYKQKGEGRLCQVQFGISPTNLMTAL
jgi:hypothetical protein